MIKNWKTFRYRVEEVGCRLLAASIPMLSRQGCVGLGQVLGALVYYCDLQGRNIALQNLGVALGHRLSDSQIRDVARMSYQNFAVTMLSLFWSQRITEDNAGRYLEMTGFEDVLKRARAEKRGVVFVCAHAGNWEWCALAFSLLGEWASIVTEDFKNPSLTDLFIRLRGRSRHRMIAQDKSVLKMLRSVLREEHAGLLGDLTLHPGRAATVISTFPRQGVPLEMCATRLHALLAKRGNALLVPVLSMPLPNGRCRVMAQLPLETEGKGERRLAQETWDVFESYIQENPHLWLWAYKHFRYRPAKPARQYPEYSCRSSEFEAMRLEE